MMASVGQANQSQRKEMMMEHEEAGDGESAEIHSAYDDSTQPDQDMLWFAPLEK